MDWKEPLLADFRPKIETNPSFQDVQWNPCILVPEGMMEHHGALWSTIASMMVSTLAHDWSVMGNDGTRAFNRAHKTYRGRAQCNVAINHKIYFRLCKMKFTQKKRQNK